MERRIPAIDNGFNLEKSLLEFGFEGIDKKDAGYSVAYGYVDLLHRDILVIFNNTYISDFQADMMITADTKGKTDVLFMGIAPTNYHDFEMLMQYLIPTQAFSNLLYINHLQDQIINS